MQSILGLDIGGANLKAVCPGKMARTMAFPLWKHPQGLSAKLYRLCADTPVYEMIALTMTAELCDCFSSKREGVRAILQGVHDFAASTPMRVWSTQQRFLDWHDAHNDPLSVAAANWLALAHFVAREFPQESVLLIDSGSTTTDLVYLQNGVPQPRGWTDLERLETGELVYTGVRRTPLCAVLGMNVAAEFFATMLDAYIYLELLPENAADHDTADGRTATRAWSHGRLAHMRCADAETFSPAQARALAESALQAQWQKVQSAVARVLQDRAPVQRIVLSGSGEVLGQAVCARQPSLIGLPIATMSELLGPGVSEAACAHAVAVLAANGS